MKCVSGWLTQRGQGDDPVGELPPFASHLNGASDVAFPYLHLQRVLHVFMIQVMFLWKKKTQKKYIKYKRSDFMSEALINTVSNTDRYFVYSCYSSQSLFHIVYFKKAILSKL